jgi:hypothetical protein
VQLKLGFSQFKQCAVLAVMPLSINLTGTTWLLERMKGTGALALHILAGSVECVFLASVFHGLLS